jgi:hypothetical protein
VSKARDSRKYRNTAKRLKRANTTCWLCGGAIDPALPYTHPLSWTADHVHPIGAGGDVHGELKPAHRSCNSSRGKGTNRTPKLNPTPTSRRW